MTTVRIMAGNATADVDERIVSGLLLPFGEIGQTNEGEFSIDAEGLIEIPDDLSVLPVNEQHDPMEPRARFATATETPAGIMASFKIGRGAKADKLLQRIADGKKNGKPVALSAEFRAVIDRATKKLVSGELTGAAFVDRGAFKSAAVLAAFEDGSVPPVDGVITFEPDADGVITVTASALPTSVDVTVGEDTTTFTTNTETEGSDVGQIPNTIQAGVRASAPAEPTYREIKSIMAAIGAGTATDQMIARIDGQFSNQGRVFAALTDVKYDAAGSPKPYQDVPQWIGELWSGLDYRQLYADLIAHGDLTAKTMSGFKWTTKPQGGDWAGNKTNVPSNAPATTPWTDTADLFAGGHDIAIEHKLFNTPGYFETYWEAMGESYKRWVDAKVIAKLKANATATVADNPAGLTIGAGLSAVIDGAVGVVAANALPTFALVHPTLYKQILKTPTQSVLGYLNAALDFKEGELNGFTIRPSTDLATGNVLVGAKDAAKLYELPGVPVRVEAPDTVKGGVDTNMFGAQLTAIQKTDALQLITPYGA